MRIVKNFLRQKIDSAIKQSLIIPFLFLIFGDAYSSFAPAMMSKMILAEMSAACTSNSS